jgi:hypothetical protein
VLINSISDFRKAVRNGPYAWPGGYPLYWIMADGSAIAFDVARVSYEGRRMLEALRDNATGNWPARADEWRPVAIEINWEDENLVCDHTGENIPSAYGED